jgi:lysophospholipase L1-like esterase
MEYTRPEFAYFRKINSLGLCEQEIAVEKPTHEYRIIALGDSYTEGVGTNYNFTWVKMAEKRLAANVENKKITTINAGISGSDPYYEYILLKEKLLPFDPDLVVVVTNGSDVEDIIIRGGMERFRPDGSVVTSRKKPDWEWLYGISYIFRHVIHDVLKYDWLFIKAGDFESEQFRAAEKIKLAIDEFAGLSEKHGFDLLVVAHPRMREVEMEEYDGVGFSNLISTLKKEQGIHFVDLLDYFKVNNLMTKENASDFYWPIDRHFNSKGYEFMGNAIADKILELKLIDR